ncbi:MAG: class I SAM-dependent methyltransferase [Nanoarchaeota archaeon]|mgnify:CR=1 FL=1
MVISIDELCERLNVQEVSVDDYLVVLKEWRATNKGVGDPQSLFIPNAAPDLEQARWFDGFALPATRVIVPFVCESLKGSKYVLDIGSGTALRLAYYAIAHPTIRFLGMDRDPAAIALGKERVALLGLTNVELREGDIRTTSKEQWDRVTFTEVAHPDWSDVEIESVVSRAEYLVGDAPGSMLISLEYGGVWGGGLEYQLHRDDDARRAGFQHTEREGFGYKHPSGVEMEGTLVRKIR